MLKKRELNRMVICDFRMMIVYYAFLVSVFRCCSLTRPLVDWEVRNSIASTSIGKEEELETNRFKLSNIEKSFTDIDINTLPRKEAVTIDEQGSDDRTNETKPVQSARWDQYHRFPQTIEAAPRAIHHIIETSKKLLDPFQISKLIMASIPDTVKEFAWYLVLGLAAVWAIFIVTICLVVTVKVMKIGCCMMKNSMIGIKATSKIVKTSCAGRRRKNNIVHNQIENDV